jgi:hypothetical protein
VPIDCFGGVNELISLSVVLRFIYAVLVMACGLGAQNLEYSINLTIFIPAHLVPEDYRVPLGSCLVYFSGDDRTFSSGVGQDCDSPPRCRVRQLVTLRRVESQWWLNEKKFAGETKAYAADALGGDRRIVPAAEADLIEDDCHLLHKKSRALTDAMTVTFGSSNPQEVQVRLTGGVANPFAPKLLAVNWDVQITISTASAKPRCTVTGWHPEYPAYEIYINKVPFYNWAPDMHRALDVLRLCAAAYGTPWWDTRKIEKSMDCP